ncbi:hypothetical protein [Herbidospora cretacea]|nr:hypothetical protein [Herbidospora cretacea]
MNTRLRMAAAVWVLQLVAVHHAEVVAHRVGLPYVPPTPYPEA